MEVYMLGSLLGSVASGVLGLFGQNSANEANQEAAQSQYTWGVADMKRAGLNPAAMYSGGFSGAPMPQQQNALAAASGAAKDAVSSAVQMNIAQKTIDNLTEQIAKTNAEAAQVKAATPGVAARAALDVFKTDAIRKIPEAVRIPVYQGGFGADTMSSAGKLASGLGAGAAVGGGVAGKYVPSIKISPPDFSSAKRGYLRALEAAKASNEGSSAKAARKRREWYEWMTGGATNSTVIYKQ